MRERRDEYLDPESITGVLDVEAMQSLMDEHRSEMLRRPDHDLIINRWRDARKKRKYSDHMKLTLDTAIGRSRVEDGNCAQHKAFASKQEWRSRGMRVSSQASTRKGLRMVANGDALYDINETEPIEGEPTRTFLSSVRFSEPSDQDTAYDPQAHAALSYLVSAIGRGYFDIGNSTDARLEIEWLIGNSHDEQSPLGYTVDRGGSLDVPATIAVASMLDDLSKVEVLSHELAHHYDDHITDYPDEVGYDFEPDHSLSTAEGVAYLTSVSVCAELGIGGDLPAECASVFLESYNNSNGRPSEPLWRDENVVERWKFAHHKICDAIRGVWMVDRDFISEDHDQGISDRFKYVVTPKNMR